MLLGIDPLISPDLLRMLAQMGHGDEIVVCDANFPAEAVARRTVHGTSLRLDADAPRTLKAILSLLPLDEHEPDAVLTMQVVGHPLAVPDVVADALPILAGIGHAPASLERFAFYDRAARAFGVVRSAETRPYGNFILRKGVVPA